MLWRGRRLPAEVLGVLGTVLLVFGYFAPAVLKWPSAGWWRLALILGYVNARIILIVAFAVILAPIGLLWRLIGHDPLARGRHRWPGWVPRHQRYRSPDHYKRMY